MLLALDVGNTETTVGLFDGDRLDTVWRLTTTAQRTPDEWAVLLTAHLSQAGRSTEEVRAAIVASVAPPVTQDLCAGVRRATGRSPVVWTPVALPIHLDEEPLTVGADRTSTRSPPRPGCSIRRHRGGFRPPRRSIASHHDGHFIGGVIMPGLRTAADELVRKTANLPATELVPPERVIGRRTEECIRAGVLLGTADAVDGIVRRIKAEWPDGRRPRVIATGGLAPIVRPLCREIEAIDPDLTLVGLRIAATALGLAW
jgi:type III pantothenate kinase